jgi:GlcNAc-P-P-Und epimerase
MPIKIIVTGGSGFIGTNIIQYYLDKNFVVFNIDIARPIHPAHLNYWISGDLRDDSHLTEIFKEISPTHVVHLAARTDLKGKTMGDYSSNIQGVQNVIAAINSCVGVEKAIFASSMLVCRVGYIPKNFDDYCPNTAYGESKVETEKIIKQSEISCAWNIIRPTSIWGPWFGEPYRNFFDLVIGGWYLNMKGRTATKTFGFIGNAVYQIDKLLFLQDFSENSRSYYIGDNPPINISEWADEILIELGKPRARLVPFRLFELAALCGDVLNKFGCPFPMNKYRLKNMTTDNIINLDDLYIAVSEPPYSRSNGIRITLDWINNHKF